MKLYREGSFYFNLLIFGFVTVLLIVSLGYDKVTRLVPLLVLVPATILSLYCLVGVFYPVLLKRTTIDLMSTQLHEKEADDTEPEPIRLAGNRGLLTVTVWLIFFAVLAVFFGFYIAFPIGLFLYFKFAGNSSWIKSLIISVAFTAVIYLSFNFLMRVTLFRGVIFGDLFIF